MVPYAASARAGTNKGATCVFAFVVGHRAQQIWEVRRAPRLMSCCGHGPSPSFSRSVHSCQGNSWWSMERMIWCQHRADTWWWWSKVTSHGDIVTYSRESSDIIWQNYDIVQKFTVEASTTAATGFTRKCGMKVQPLPLHQHTSLHLDKARARRGRHTLAYICIVWYINICICMYIYIHFIYYLYIFYLFLYPIPYTLYLHLYVYKK